MSNWKNLSNCNVSEYNYWILTPLNPEKGNMLSYFLGNFGFHMFESRSYPGLKRSLTWYLNSEMMQFDRFYGSTVFQFYLEQEKEF